MEIENFKYILCRFYCIIFFMFVNKKENEKQIEKFLRAHEEFSLVDEKTIFSDTRQDGFYMAKLVRKWYNER